MNISDDIKLDYCDVLIQPRPSSLATRSEVNLVREFTFKHTGLRDSFVPIWAANMDTVGTVAMARSFANYDGDWQVGESPMVALHKFNINCWKEWMNEISFGRTFKIPTNISISSGANDKDYNFMCDVFEKLGDFAPTYICLDVANGYSKMFNDFVKKVRDNPLFAEKVIIAGNVVTAETTRALLNAGADIIKIGIGPGSVCTTRVKAGVGYPQLSAISECHQAASEERGHIMADGGCTCPGDVAKAFGAGADMVMLGGLLAGHTESEGKIVVDGNGHSSIEFYGMSSDTAMKKYNGGVANYRASEGKTVRIPFRGSVEHTLRDLLGGIRSACTYVGAKNIGELADNTQFVRVNRQVNGVFAGS